MRIIKNKLKYFIYKKKKIDTKGYFLTPLFNPTSNFLGKNPNKTLNINLQFYLQNQFVAFIHPNKKLFINNLFFHLIHTPHQGENKGW